MEGNEAIAWGAVASECRFFAGYPITPATTIFNTLLKLLPPLGGICLQGEDEIASIGYCLGASMAGLNVTQKNEYDITVLRGACISEVVLSPEEIGYTGITTPDVVLALSQEGVDRRKHLFDQLDKNARIIRAEEINLPLCNARVIETDFKAEKIKSNDRALAALCVLAELDTVICPDMLEYALASRFKDNLLTSVLDLVRRVKGRGAK